MRTRYSIPGMEIFSLPGRGFNTHSYPGADQGESKSREESRLCFRKRRQIFKMAQGVYRSRSRLWHGWGEGGESLSHPTKKVIEPGNGTELGEGVYRDPTLLTLLACSLCISALCWCSQYGELTLADDQPRHLTQ